MKHLLFSFFLFGFFFSYTQSPQYKQWDYRFGGSNSENFTCFKQTSNGGYILGGSTNSANTGDVSQLTRGDYDFWIVKTDSLGTKQWDKRYGGEHQEYLYDLQQTDDGGYILGGVTVSGLSGDVSQNYCNGVEKDFWMVKIDSLGNKQWDKRFGGNNKCLLQAIRQTNDKGYILGGWTQSDSACDISYPSRGTQDYWVVKTDSIGNKEWDKRFGGNNTDFFNSLQQTKDGGYILGGETISYDTLDVSEPGRGTFDYWMVKTDSQGNKQWDKRFGGNSWDQLFSVEQTLDGGYILAGSSYSATNGDVSDINNGDSDCWIVKTDSMGNKEWDKMFGGLASEGGFFTDPVQPVYATQTKDKGYLITSNSWSSIGGSKTESNLGSERQMWAVKTDSFGNKLWDKTILSPGSSNYGHAIETKDGCYVFANSISGDVGGYKTQISRGETDYWFTKFCLDSVSSVSNIFNTTQLSISPNPFSSSITVSLQKENLQQANLTVTDVIGRVVTQFQITNANFQINTANWATGVYFLQVTADGERSVRQLVKQ